MNAVLKQIKEFTLPIAMIFGIATFKWLYRLSFLSPYLLFLMLFFTFCKIDTKNMRLNRVFAMLAAIQLIGGAVAYLIGLPFSQSLAEGLMLCFLMPTGTATAVITQKLGGSIEEITTYTLLSNLMIAIVVPILFPFIQEHLTTDSLFSFGQFWQIFWTIAKRVFPMLIGPFLLALLLRVLHRRIKGTELKLPKWLSAMPFYIWAFSLSILMATTTNTVVHAHYEWHQAVWLLAGSLMICLFQFFVGKAIGKHRGDVITDGQALGQKNTILGIWLCDSYLNPISALGPAAYVVWQNIFNSTQLYLHDKAAAKSSAC